MARETVKSAAKLGADGTQLVTFLLKDEEFGFDIMSVQEIIRLPKMARVPRTPPFVDGIANLRGVVLPIVDMRTRFGMERAEETDRTRVLVVDIDKESPMQKQKIAAGSIIASVAGRPVASLLDLQNIVNDVAPDQCDVKLADSKAVVAAVQK